MCLEFCCGEVTVKENLHGQSIDGLGGCCVKEPADKFSHVFGHYYWHYSLSPGTEW